MGLYVGNTKYKVMSGGSPASFMVKNPDEVIMTSSTNPEVLAICYAQGWCVNSDYMTKTEAEAVTSFGTAFQGSAITTFDELVYFSNITSLAYNSFKNSTIQRIWFPYVTDFGSQQAANACLFSGCSSLSAARFDSLSSVAAYNYPLSSMYTVLTMNAVPNMVGGWNYGTFYVLDSLVTDYQNTGKFNRSAGVKAISSLATDHPDCPWLEDLREKGLIT